MVNTTTKPTEWSLGLSGKFILLSVVFLGLTLGLVTFHTVQQQKKMFAEQLEEKGRLLGYFVSLISPEAILGYDFETLNHFVKEVSSRQDMVYAAVFDTEGHAMTSHLDAQNPLIAETLKHLDTPDIAGAITALREQPRVEHLEFPIYAPYNATPLGHVAVGVDNARVYRLARETALRQSVSSLIIILVLSLGIYLVFRYYALRPIRNLVAGSRRMAEGRLEEAVPELGRDELGHLTRAFNDMMARLNTTLREKNQALNQLAELNRTLEDKVEQRTQELAKANEAISALNDRLKQENLRMSAELEVTRQLQKMVLPSDQELAQIKELDIACFMEPAEEVGGDYYDVLQHEGQVKIAIGDVTGHGLESGVLMLMVQMAVRTLLASNISNPEHFMTILNRAVFDNVRRMKSDKNLTLSLLDYVAGILHITGQHEEILVVRKGGKVERIDTLDLGFMVGLEPDITPFLAQSEIRLEPGDGVVLYTDGITEAMNDDRQLYGIERLCQILSDHWEYPARDIQQAVITDLRKHIGRHKVYDDITLLVIKQK